MKKYLTIGVVALFLIVALVTLWPEKEKAKIPIEHKIESSQIHNEKPDSLLKENIKP